MRNKSIKLFTAMFLIVACTVSVTAFAAGVSTFDLGFKDTVKSDISGSTFDRFTAYRTTLPERMPVYEPQEPSGEIKIFISPDGKDGNSGTIDKPVKTLECALDLLKNYKDRSKGAVIYFRGGDYYFNNAVNVPSSLSGTDDCPLYISSYNNEIVNIYGTNFSSGKSYSAVNLSDDLKQRLNSKYISNIRVLDLAESDFEYSISRTGAPSIYINDIKYEPARWPNSSYRHFSQYRGANAVAGVIDSGDCNQHSGYCVQ